MLKIYGASDDLIEIEGDIHEEFPALSEFDNGDGEDGGFLALSDGTVLRIQYENSGVWRIKPVVFGPGCVIVPAPEDDEDNYSDVATIDSEIKWAVLGGEFRKA